MHTFAPQQPDLNWSNPEVQAAMQQNIRFWLDRGVDGFRIDAINHAGKNMDLPDEPINTQYKEGIDNPYDQLKRVNSADYETLDNYLKAITNVLGEPAYKNRDTHMVFEAYTSLEVLKRINAIAPRAAGAFNFSRMQAPWQASAHRQLIADYLDRLPDTATANHVSGNHDNSRLASRLGLEAAKATAVIDACLPGQVYIYNGEEAGLLDVEVPPELSNDKLGLRDAARTPLPWNNDMHGGFSQAAKTWLPVTPDYEVQNIALQAIKKDSTLSFYKRLLNIRRGALALRKGKYIELSTDHDEHIFAFARSYGKQIIIVLVNFAEHQTTVRVTNPPAKTVRPLLSSRQRSLPKITSLTKPITLGPHEAVIASNATAYVSTHLHIKR